MSEFIHLINFSWITLVIGILLLAGLLALEISRKNRRNLSFRLLAITTVAIAIMAILWKPSYYASVESERIILVGDATSDDQLKRLLSVNKHTKILYYDSLHQHIGPQNVLVTGQGIPSYDHWKLAQAHVEYQPGDPIEGIQLLEFRNELTRGDSLHVSGNIKNQDSLLITFSQYGQILDSTFTDTQGTFDLKTLVQLSGKVLYTLAFPNNPDLSTETLAIFVHEQKKHRIAMFSTYPTFEMRQLKEFLADFPHEVLVRNQISRDRFSYEYLNTSQSTTIRPDAGFFGTLDVLFIDQNSLEGFNSSQLVALENAVRAGMGLLIFPENGRAGIGSMSLPLERVADRDSSGYQFVPKVTTEIIQSTAAFKWIGKGKVAVSLGSSSYTLMLQGETSAYNNYWASVMNRISRGPEEPYRIQKWPPVVHEPVVLQISSEVVPETMWDATPLPPVQDEYVPINWTVTVWPADTGWHEFILNKDTTHIFVYSDKHYEALRYSQQRNEMLSFDSQEDTNRTAVSEKRISPIWFYMLILLGLCFLWLERKMTHV
jgi:hypothetical protein